MLMKLWTMSYDGQSAAEIVDKLRENGIERVVHIGSAVRDIEDSSSEERLARDLNRAGIELERVEGAGERSGSGAIFADRGNDEHMTTFNGSLGCRSQEMDKLRKKAEERPTAILCFLRGERACEGAVIVQLLQERARIRDL